MAADRRLALLPFILDLAREVRPAARRRASVPAPAPRPSSSASSTSCSRRSRSNGSTGRCRQATGCTTRFPASSARTAPPPARPASAARPLLALPSSASSARRSGSSHSPATSSSPSASISTRFRSWPATPTAGSLRRASPRNCRPCRRRSSTIRASPRTGIGWSDDCATSPPLLKACRQHPLHQEGTRWQRRAGRSMARSAVRW